MVTIEIIENRIEMYNQENKSLKVQGFSNILYRKISEHVIIINNCIIAELKELIEIIGGN